MATTRLIPMHVIKDQTAAFTVSERIAYAINPAKTRGGELVAAYGCDPSTAAAEMMLNKRGYEAVIGRELNRKSDVLLYQIRQAFLPGEITPEQANKIGYELAMSFTKGKYQFIVATHIDKDHIHNHVIFNSTAIEQSRKFRNFWGSSFAVRRISDKLCLENGLSIVENPKQGGKHYGKWLGDSKPLTWQDKLRRAIDAALAEKPADFAAFLRLVQAAGYEIKPGQNLAFRTTGQQKYTRLRSLGEGYGEQDIRAIIEGKQPIPPSRLRSSHREIPHVNLLIDIQAKLLSGKGAGYERWAKVFNLKQAAQTLNFLTENKLLEYDQLAEKTATATTRFNELSGQIKKAEARMNEIAKLKTHIVNYSKTREVYTQYRKAGYSINFYAQHETEILMHKAAKQAFDALQVKKLPTVKALQVEYAALLADKKKAYQEYAQARKEMRELLTAKANVDKLLGVTPEQKEKENERPQR